MLANKQVRYRFSDFTGGKPQVAEHKVLAKVALFDAVPVVELFVRPKLVRKSV